MSLHVLRKYFKNLFAVLSSVIICVIFLEILLRLSGFFFLSLQEYNNKKLAQKSAQVKVLCIGESTTALGGGDSYPSQLQRLLDEQGGGRFFKVINKGIPGQGTTYIAEHFPAWLKEYRPQIVVMMLGINDHNSNIPVDDVIRKGAWHERMLSDLRVFKLYRWIVTSLRHRQAPQASKGPRPPAVGDAQPSVDVKVAGDVRKLVAAMQALEGGKYALAEALYQDVLQHGVPQLRSQAGEKLIRLYHMAGAADPLMAVLKDRIPQDISAQMTVVELCREKKYVDEIKGLLTGLVRDQSRRAYDYYNLLGSCLAAAGQPDEAAVYFQKLRSVDERLIKPETSGNYVKLLNAARSQGAVVIAMQYPLRPIASLRTLLQGWEGFSSVILVENKDNFQKVLATRAYEDLFTDRFAGDFGHCTSLGNRLIAENVARVILRGR